MSLLRPKTVPALGCLLSLCGWGAGAVELPPARVGLPRSMAVLGDSMSTAALSTRPERNQWEYCWATGDSELVQSHALRIQAALSSSQVASPAQAGVPAEPGAPVEVRTYNAAVSGERMKHLEAQALRVVAEQPEYVAILMGANDACAQREEEMTSVEDFRAQFAAGLDTLTRGLPEARIYVLSVPDVRRLYDLYSDDPVAQFVWGLARSCPTMLGKPGSTAPEDEARRERVRQRIRDYNQQLQEVCAEHLRCRFDGHALFSYAFTRRDVSNLDHFHPSREGQRQIAALSWDAGFDFQDVQPPRTTAQVTHTAEGVQVRLSAVDNVEVRGVEYQRGGVGWLRYTAPLLLGPGETLRFRAVDVNGNVEGALQLEADTAPPMVGAGPEGAGMLPRPADETAGGCAAGGGSTGGAASWSALALLLSAAGLRRRRRST